MRILLTNDDGIDAPGIRSLHQAIQHLGDVHVVAPATVQSAMGHAVTFHRPLEVRAFPYEEPGGGSSEGNGGGDTNGYRGYAVDGRPADCVKLGLRYLVPEAIEERGGEGGVEVVISGMNAGCNIGINVNYSGTVAAAREAAFLGLPAIAVSLHIGDPSKTRWEAAAHHARQAIDRVLQGPLREHTLVNINIPILDDDKEPCGTVVVPACTSPMDYEYTRVDPDATVRTYQRHDGLKFKRQSQNTDVARIFEGYITITPLHFDATDHEHLDTWRDHLTSSK